MQLITDTYLDLNRKLHESNPNFGTSGQKYVSEVIELVTMVDTQDILDYGCGKSTLAMNLPFSIKQYDPAVPKYAAQPKEADIVVCTDVVEHIEPVYIDNVLDHLQLLTRKACFIAGSTVPARKTLEDGRNAHLIIKPARWWVNQLWDRFEVIRFTQSKSGFTAVLVKRTAR